MKDCALARRHLDAYLDGELSPTPMLEVEEHLAGCPDCLAEHALSAALKRELKARAAATRAPDGLRRQVVAALSGVRGEPTQGDHSHVWMTASAVAASVLLVLGAVFGTDATRSNLAVSAAPQAAEIAHDVVLRHKDELPTEIVTPIAEQATSWFRNKLGFRVRGVEFGEPQVRLIGARVSQVGAQPAAKLYYSLGDSRLTVVLFKASPALHEAFDSESERLRWGAQRVRLGEHDVTYRSLQGYTVPMLEQDGVVYAFTGDLDQRRLLQLVAGARIPR